MTDYDSPWKEALDAYLAPFLAFCFPHVARALDWSHGYESLDKELQQIVHDAEVGRRYVDKLVRAWLADGSEQWVLIHVEVQGRREIDFPCRMYVYNYRIFDRYNREVVSLAVLADDDPDWRPTRYESELFGCRKVLEFPAVKLLDYAGRETALETDANPFAALVLAHLKTLETRGAPADRQAWKFRIVRGLYERGISAQDIRRLFRFIDWMMDLPPMLENLFLDDVIRYQQEKHMPFMDIFERMAQKKGLQEGLLKAIELGLELRFGPEGLALLSEISPDLDIDTLEAIRQALKTVRTPEELRRIWAS